MLEIVAMKQKRACKRRKADQHPHRFPARNQNCVLPPDVAGRKLRSRRSTYDLELRPVNMNGMWHRVIVYDLPQLKRVERNPCIDAIHIKDNAVDLVMMSANGNRRGIE